jgi:hypothetical protein
VVSGIGWAQNAVDTVEVVGSWYEVASGVVSTVGGGKLVKIRFQLTASLVFFRISFVIFRSFGVLVSSSVSLGTYLGCPLGTYLGCPLGSTVSLGQSGCLSAFPLSASRGRMLPRGGS